MGEPQKQISLQEALTQYQQILLAARNLAPRTRTDYTNDLQDLVDFLETRCFLFLAHRVERSQMECYFAELDQPRIHRQHKAPQVRLAPLFLRSPA